MVFATIIIGSSINCKANFLIKDSIIVKDIEMQEIVRNILPFKLRACIDFTSMGLLNLDNTCDQDGEESFNWKVIKRLASDNKFYDLQLKERFSYKDVEGAYRVESMNLEYVQDLDGKLVIDGWRGVTQTPFDGTEKYSSVDSNVKVVVNPQLRYVDRLKNLCHEMCGHAYLYSLGEDHSHDYRNNGEGLFIDKNKRLQDCISNSQEELTIK